MKLKWIIAVGFCILLAFVVIPRFFISRDLPQKLHGVWETDEPRYEDRHFLLDKNAIGFETGYGIIDWYEITQVDQSTKRNDIIYIIKYKSGEGAVFKRSLIYNSENGGTIRFENQADIEWFPVDT
jgi:hypothetical protein